MRYKGGGVGFDFDGRDQESIQDILVAVDEYVLCAGAVWKLENKVVPLKARARDACESVGRDMKLDTKGYVIEAFFRIGCGK